MSSNEVSYENGRLTIIRFFKAKRTAVFDAWMKTSKVQLWWGCADAERVKSDIEPWPGGRYEHTMQLKDVGSYQHHGRITDYNPPALLAYELLDPMHNEPMLIRVTFSEQEGGTLVRLTQENLPPAYSEFVLAGWSDGFDKLAAFLATENARARLADLA